MNTNVLGAEAMNIVPAIIPIDLNAGANAGDWVSMKNYHRCTVVAFAAVGSASNDLTLTMEQATDVSGTGAKALTFTRIDVKEAVSLLAVGQYTTVEQAAANTYVSATNGESQLVYLIDFLGEDLDVDNGFDCLRLSINDAGAAKVGCALYLMRCPRYQPSADLLPSAIVN